jgi:hypothetical protein
MNRSFSRILVTGAITFLLLTTIGLIAIATQSSIGLLRGGVYSLPLGSKFVAGQAPAMVSVLVNPEKLYGIRQVTLPLAKRVSDRQQWQEWSRNNFSKLGLDYQQLKPWLGNELTLAITALDYDRNLNNGVQPGYLLVAEARNNKLAQEFLDRFYPQQHRSVEVYKGANIVSHTPENRAKSIFRSSTLVGNLVLFANQPQIIREAINQAQAVDLNLEHLDNYQEAIANVTKPRVAISYIDVAKTLAWLNKSGVVEPDETNVNRALSAFLSINQNLVIHTALNNATDSQASFEVFESLLNNPELERVFEYLFLPGESSTYIDLNTKIPSTTTPFYEVAKLAIKGLFPHLDAIAIEDKGNENNTSHTEILFKLDN